MVNISTKGKKPIKKDFDVKSLVGKRIKVEWKTGAYKGWHKGTIIGYTSNLKNNLIYYDKRDHEHSPQVDYYSHNLFGNQINWVFL